ncbi:helix-turn-helix domain-containing protein [Flavobacterium sp. Sd200]|uniref:AraC family transcriptional regulator n=1 Tax=Flavobacterium sp. Sd200 TaxID=2692211 RepID=UPI0013679E0D|nr:AraC family transcriptional regulator [Flavobacterium sp. Sd200]MXN89726.1 helix-turn-helix domain-containing protein [Flavobacterium sp. Sd200]
MKPFIERLPVAEGNSFVANTHRTPRFEVPWHQHVEYELILITEGSGLSFIGNYVGEFKVGDIFFIGSNVPHTFKKENEQITSAVVVQFTDMFWGSDFLALPENKLLRDLLRLSMKGIKPEGRHKAALAKLIKKLEHCTGIVRISTLLECLSLLIEDENKTILSTNEMPVLNEKYQDRMDNIFKFTISNFQNPITLNEIASIANMTVTAFCFYFKKSTKKSYIEFLNEIRIGHACKLLQNTSKTVTEICYESGFNTAANFNKQFIKYKKSSPSHFRASFKEVKF